MTLSFTVREDLTFWGGRGRPQPHPYYSPITLFIRITFLHLVYLYLACFEVTRMETDCRDLLEATKLENNLQRISGAKISGIVEPADPLPIVRLLIMV